MSSSEEIHLIAREAGREGARELMLQLGIDVTDHDAVQAFQSDLAYVRSMREFHKIVGRKITTTFVGAFVIAVLYAVWEGVRHYLPGQ
jgi:hypothetical protein